MKYSKVQDAKTKCVSYTNGLMMEAMSAAINAGIVPKADDEEGWDVSSFMDFWERFEPTLIKALESCGALEIY